MRSQAHLQSIIENGTLTPLIDVRSMTEETATELSLMYNITGEDTLPFDLMFYRAYDVADDRLLLRNNSELVYTVPQNTTLVEVLGPVGNADNYSEYGLCYAHLNPRPSWWLSPSYPTSDSDCPVNVTDQTMFLLPVDPEIVYQLRVGALGNDTTCPVSAIRTYPFYQ